MAADGLELRLRRLEACEAIRKLIALYAIGADRKNDPAVLAPLFSADAVWEADGVAHLTGCQAISRGLSDLANQFVTWSLHYMVSPLIDIEDDALSARCRWYLWELCTMNQNGTAADTWYGGWYDSKLSVHDGVWLFDWVRLDPRIASANEEPWAGKIVNEETGPYVPRERN